jgi:hypothetical protein
MQGQLPIPKAKLSYLKILFFENRQHSAKETLLERPKKSELPKY